MTRILATYLFLIPLFVLLLSEVVKFVVASLRLGEPAYDHFFRMGGFPSSHSAFVTSLLIVVGKKTGIESVEFAIAAVFAAIIWYDAMSARREIGLQAEALNRLQRRERFRTHIGHSFREVVGGVAFGAVVTLLGIWVS